MFQRKAKIPFKEVVVILLLANLFLGNTPLNEEDFHKSRVPTVQEVEFKELSFADESVPVDDKRVQRLIKHEIRIQSHWQGNVNWINDKAMTYFPIITPVLKEYGIPEDFKYLPMVESGFTGSVSYAGAQGYWQLMPMAGRMGRLEMNAEVDERYHLRRSSEAACRVLKALHDIFHNWALVAAAYNTGVTNVQNALNAQKTASFYELNMNSQTTILVYRLVALKEIYEHPVKYGYKENNDASGKDTIIKSIMINKPISSLANFAKENGVTLKTLKAYNPWMRGPRLRNPHHKNYEIYLPAIIDSKPKKSAFAFMDLVRI